MTEYENAVELKGVTKKYDGFTLSDVSFSVPKGCIMGFIGQNGAGKTTTIRSMLNIVKPDSGEIKLLGLDNIRYEMEIKSRIAAVFDELPFHDCLNVRDISRIFQGLYSEWDSSVYSQYTERFELPSKKKIGDFSKGMKMKLQIACALSHNAELLVMDEATTGLDPVVRDEILHIFMEYIRNGERSVLMSSHITSDLEKTADMVTLIDNGRILLTGCKDEITESYGILKCSRSEVNDIDATDIVSVRVNEYGAEVMVTDRAEAARRYSGAVIDPADIDDIMLFHVHRDEKEWS